MKTKPSKGRDKPKKQFGKGIKGLKSFSDLHGTKSDVFDKVSPEQLGHDQQLPVASRGSVNPNPSGMASPLINPGESGHPVPMSGHILGQSQNFPSGEEFY